MTKDEFTALIGHDVVIDYPFFNELQGIDDETLAIFTKAMSTLADNIGEP